MTFGLAMARRATDVTGTVIGEVSDRVHTVGRAISTATRTATGQARSAFHRSSAAVRGAAAETSGQARAQPDAVADTIRTEAEDLLDDAAAAADPRPIDPNSLDDLTKTDLYDRAQAADIEGRSNMSKADLIEALRR